MKRLLQIGLLTLACTSLIGACLYTGPVEDLVYENNGGTGAGRCNKDEDCEPTHGCDRTNDRCRLRCKDDGVCGEGECFVDMCSEPLGTPCNNSHLSPCGGPRCTNVNAQNITVPYYCSRSCFLRACPDGYTCETGKCLVN